MSPSVLAPVAAGTTTARCAKTMPRIQAAIEARLAEGTMNAKGDNCEGWFGE